MHQSRKMQIGGIFTNLINKGEEVPSGQEFPSGYYLDTMNGLFIPKEGWYFYEKTGYSTEPKDGFWKFRGDQNNLKFMERLPLKDSTDKMIFYQAGWSIATFFEKGYIFGEFSRTREPKDIPPIDLFPSGYRSLILPKR